MRVLVTGASGFVGGHVVSYLSSNGHDPIGTDIIGTQNKGDVADRDFVIETLSKLDFEAVVHLAGIADLKKTIEDPYLCYQVNCLGTLNMLELATRKRVKRFVYACHDERTRVFTAAGLKRYDELRVGDMVLTINPRTGIIEVQPTERIYIYPFDGSMIHFDGKRADLLVTPNHKMLVEVPVMVNGRVEWKAVFEEAETVAERSVCRLVSGQWSGFEKLSIDLKGELHDLVDLFYLTGLFVGAGGLNSEQLQEPTAGASGSQLLQYHGGLGGFTQQQVDPQRKELHHPRILLHLPENDKARQGLEEVLRRSSLGWSGCKKSIHFTSESLYKLFEQCYAAPPFLQGARTKRVPKWMLQASRTLLSALLRGLLDSGGSRGRILSTTSVGLIEDTMELCARLGYFTSCSPRRTISRVDGRPVESWSFQVGISSRAGTPIFGTVCNNVHSEYYRGNVFCIEVKNHNFLVERNGKIAFSGNSSANVYGAPMKLPVREDSPIDPRVPYDYSKVVGEAFAMSYHKTKGLPVSITRSWLLFGEYDAPTRAVPRFVSSCLRNEQIRLFNSGRDTTAPSHALNYAKLVKTILENDASVGRAFNFGGEKVLSIRQLAERIKKLTGSSSELVMLPPRSEAEREPQISYPKTDGLKGLGYEYELSLDEGIRRTVEWIRRSTGER